MMAVMSPDFGPFYFTGSCQTAMSPEAQIPPGGQSASETAGNSDDGGQSRFRELLARAIAFHKAASLPEAAAIYEQLLVHRPDHPGVLHLLGVLRHTQGDHHRAIALLGRAVALTPDDAACHAAYGAALRGGDRMEEAVAAYDRALALRPDSAETHNNRGIALQQLGRIDAAIAAYEAALARRPDYAEACNNLGTALRRGGRLEAAESAFRRALGHRPDYFDALGNLGKLQIEIGKNAAALETYQRLLGYRATDVDALKAVGDLLVVLDRDDEALPYYAAALDIRPRDTDLLDHLAVALLVLERSGEALAIVHTAVGIDSRHAAAQLHYGIALEKVGQVPAALTALRTAIALDPAMPLAHFTLGMLCLATEAPDEARAVFAAWYEREPDHPTARHMMAAVTGTDVPQRASAAYIIQTFDSFAKTFDRQLDRLEYRAPQLLADLIAAAAPASTGPSARLAVADLGCGTGLCGPLLRPLSARLVGVDLAAGMLERARRRGVYDELVEGELGDFLLARPGAFDLIIAADTLIYFGALEEPLAAAAAALRPGGRFGFTLEAGGEAGGKAGYRLATSGRYQHAEGYVRRSLAAAGLTPIRIERATLRTEAGQPVGGLLVLAERPAGAAAA
jgi:predicted TPR repeat methyltransferase